MNLEDYNYNLPKELIAQKPKKERCDSRLMVVHENRVEHCHFRDIVDYLRKGDVLVVNESRVVPAKLIGKKETGGNVQLVITGRSGKFHTTICSRRIKVGSVLLFGPVKARVLEKHDNFVLIDFNPSLTSALLKKVGKLPIPPYIKNYSGDEECYQTVYGKRLGSIAAHTAGLHFTNALLNEIKKKGVKIAKVCLHISYSTFFPIKGSIENHKMHPEVCFINRKNAKIINNRKGRLFCVGTTVVKTLESLSDYEGRIIPGKKESNLFLHPTYSFKTKIDGLITNFHLPKSTLILLVSAYYGRKNILRIYREAIKKKYRFYSFGDAMLLLQ